MTPLALYPLANVQVLKGGAPVVAMYGPVVGGFITNPALPADQGLPYAETLYVDATGADPPVAETGSAVALQPGETFIVPDGQTENVVVNAASSKHRFAGVVFQSPTPFPPIPQSGTFPPGGTVTLTDIIPSYLYREYADDDNLQAFVNAFNSLARIYAAWFATIGLPVYTGAAIAGTLLDWIALGLYGMARPALGSGLSREIGPLNTYAFNTFPLNKRKIVGPNNITVTSDDVFKRIITWNFYKGDGNTFNVRWLKRRIKRFLIGANGTAPNVDQTDDISVTFGADGQVAIRIAVGSRTINGGAFPNRFGFNQRVPLNSLRTTYAPPATSYPLAPILQEAFEAGVLTVPFQRTFSVQT